MFILWGSRYHSLESYLGAARREDFQVCRGKPYQVGREASSQWNSGYRNFRVFRLCMQKLILDQVRAATAHGIRIPAELRDKAVMDPLVSCVKRL